MPKVSLLVPCFNAASFLPRFSLALSAMTVRFDEVIAYDDGSTDDTVAMLRSLGWRVVVGGGNRGVSHARNALVRAASCEWIHFHDADDIILPRYLERLGPLADGECDIVSCDADWIREEDGSLEIAWRYDVEGLASDPVSALLQVPMGCNSSLVRKLAWERVGGCDENLRIWEDADVHIRMALAGARMRHIPEVHTQSLRRGGSLSTNLSENARCRLRCLGSYAEWPVRSRYEVILREECERSARALLNLGDTVSAKAALDLCRRLGGKPPTTGGNLPFRFLRLVLPELVFMRIQERRRRRT
jgi:glycosyltransferase involved in cell wall biosynthesis